ALRSPGQASSRDGPEFSPQLFLARWVKIRLSSTGEYPVIAGGADGRRGQDSRARDFQSGESKALPLHAGCPSDLERGCSRVLPRRGGKLARDAARARRRQDGEQ